MRPRVIRWKNAATPAQKQECWSWLKSSGAGVTTVLSQIWLVNWRRWDG